ncbi:hypothetical protein [Xanthomonas translucens]|uniref:hypothetical protein n=1 Tax=Xanthomonas campestris pv. translucens TaxID=343 RepID=UPI0019D6FC7C|nr:hypothetical protein [Xanthomonas translucens]QSQ62200.1 hypothetical protein ISN38_19730 [Xanthomonas translucens pv. undulosa]
MAERFTIYAGEPIASVLAGYEDNRSGRLNQVAANYRLLIEALVPVFSAAQWQALVDVLGGHAPGDENGLRFAWAAVADSAADGIAEKWHVDVEALALQVRALSLPQLIALREVIARYRNSEDGSGGADDLLQRCGAKIAPSNTASTQKEHEHDYEEN